MKMKKNKQKQSVHKNVIDVIYRVPVEKHAVLLIAKNLQLMIIDIM